MEVYIDDILVKSLTQRTIWLILQETFKILRKYNMKLNPENVPLESCNDPTGHFEILYFAC